MQANDEITYQIDGDDRICEVGAAWIAFAAENNGDHLVPPFILGRKLWASISDPTTREVYRGVLGRVRRGVGPVRFHFRCDSPGMRRLLEMHVVATAANGVEFRTTLLQRQSRVDVDVLDPAVSRSELVLAICGWCVRMPAADGTWVEIEVAVRALGLLEAPVLPRLSHGMCPSCFEAMSRALDDKDHDPSKVTRVAGLPNG